MALLNPFRRFTLLCSCAAALLLLAACGGPEVPLNGTVLDAYSGKPVSAAKINLAGAEVTTDAGGKYQLASWKQDGTLQIAADGYEPVTIALSDQPQLAQPTRRP